jgi:hypothetical protein
LVGLPANFFLGSEAAFLVVIALLRPVVDLAAGLEVVVAVFAVAFSAASAARPAVVVGRLEVLALVVLVSTFFVVEVAAFFTVALEADFDAGFAAAGLA